MSGSTKTAVDREDQPSGPPPRPQGGATAAGRFGSAQMPKASATRMATMPGMSFRMLASFLPPGGRDVEQVLDHVLEHRRIERVADELAVPSRQHQVGVLQDLQVMR